MEKDCPMCYQRVKMVLVDIGGIKERRYKKHLRKGKLCPGYKLSLLIIKSKLRLIKK